MQTLVYCLKVNIISGARYHRVATYSVIKPVSVPEGSAVFTLRARPKSQTLRSLAVGQYRSTDSIEENRYLPIGIKEKVGRLQVTVDDIGRVECFEGTKGLVCKVLCVVVGKVLCADHSVHVGFHEFLNYCGLVRRGRRRQIKLEA
jgi:hypothetical protein